jgi:LEA14-like dessication related protein
MLFKDPTITVSNVALRSFSFNSLTLDVTLIVNNPNFVGISLKSLSFDVFYQNSTGWVFLSHGERTQFRVNAGENTISVPVTVQNAALLSALVGMLAKGKITIRVTGVTLPDFLLFAPKVPFSRELTVPFRLEEFMAGI